MWSNIGNVEQHKGSVEFLPSPRRSFDSGTGKPTNDALYINADCHSSVKGIFLGKSIDRVQLKPYKISNKINFHFIKFPEKR